MEFSSLFQAIKHVISSEPSLTRQDGEYAHISFVDYRQAIKIAKNRIESGEYKIT